MAGVHHGQPGAISVGTGRVYTAAEAVLWSALFGPRYTAYVAGVVCSGQGPVDHGIIARLAKEARAIRLAHVTATSLKAFLLSPVFGKRPKLVRKDTTAALAVRTGQYQALPCISNITKVTSTAFATAARISPTTSTRPARCSSSVLVSSPHHGLLLWCLLPGLQEGQGL